MHNYNAVTRAFAAAILLVQFCGGAPKESKTFVSECADIIAIRSTVEEYVRAVKHRLARTSKEYMDIEDTYSRAAETYEGSVKTLGADAMSSTKPSDAQRETLLFLDRCRAALRIDHLTDLEEPQFSAFVSTFMSTVTQQKKSERADWIRAIQAKIVW